LLIKYLIIDFEFTLATVLNNEGEGKSRGRVGSSDLNHCYHPAPAVLAGVMFISNTTCVVNVIIIIK
jgi:hypothetical protein